MFPSSKPNSAATWFHNRLEFLWVFGNFVVFIPIWQAWTHLIFSILVWLAKTFYDLFRSSCFQHFNSLILSTVIQIQLAWFVHHCMDRSYAFLLCPYFHHNLSVQNVPSSTHLTEFSILLQPSSSTTSYKSICYSASWSHYLI